MALIHVHCYVLCVGRTKIKLLLNSCALLLSSISIFLYAAENSVLGHWLTPQAVLVQTKLCGQEICGTVIHIFLEEGQDPNEILDDQNKDPLLKTRPLIGIDLLEGFGAQSVSSKKFTRGRIYNPIDGKTYKANLELLENGNMIVEGCLFVFCRDEEWRSVKIKHNQDGSRYLEFRQDDS